MAIVKHKAIRSITHITNVISYTTNEKKTTDELITGVNCDYKKVKEEFEFAKLLHNKTDCVIIAHQFYQSFKPGEVDSKTANEIGAKLINKIAPGYQGIVVTHIDREHIHNHIIINSVNVETGYMYRANKASLEYARSESDKLCREYNLSVIEERSKLRGIDQETYRTALKGDSWKMKLVNSIDEALSFSHTRDEFIEYMNKLGYEVKWQNVNISFKDSEREKFIRAKTIAKQFGEKYSKEGIENAIGEFGRVKEFESYGHSQDISENGQIIKGNDGINESDGRNSEKHVRTDSKYKRRSEKNEYERYQQWKQKHNKDLSKIPDINGTVYNMGEATRIFDNSRWSGGIHKDRTQQDIIRVLLFIALIGIKLIKRLVRSKKKNRYKITNARAFKIIGNINYKELKAMEGTNKFIKLNLDELKTIYALEKNKKFNILYSGCIKDDSIIVTVKSKDFKDLLISIGRNFEVQYGNITYKAIKESANKIEYRIVDENVLKELSRSDMKFTCFKKHNRYNLVFDSKDLEKYNIILQKMKSKNISKER